jgi:hydrogenase-4 component F
VFGLGIGGIATYGALLHMLNNAFGKGVLFMSAGNLHRGFGSRLTSEVSGALHRAPASAGLFLAGLFAITGSPPFGLFLSELTIVRGAFASENYVGAALFLALLATVFIGMSAVVIRVVQGAAPPNIQPERERLMTILPALCCLAVVLVLGIYVPPWLDDALRAAAAFLEMQP